MFAFFAWHSLRQTPQFFFDCMAAFLEANLPGRADEKVCVPNCATGLLRMEATGFTPLDSLISIIENTLFMLYNAIRQVDPIKLVLPTHW